MPKPKMPKSGERRATRPRATACTAVAARRRAASSSSSVVASPTAARGEKRLASQPTAASTSLGSAASPSAAILRSSRAAVASPHAASHPTALWRWCAAAAAAAAAASAAASAASAAAQALCATASSSSQPSSRASANSPTDRWYAIHCARSGLPDVGGSAGGGAPVVTMARPYAPSTCPAIDGASRRAPTPRRARRSMALGVGLPSDCVAARRDPAHRSVDAQ